MPGSPRRRKPVKRLKRLIIERDNGICRYCLRAIKDEEERTIDHIVPYCKGGLTIADNLVLACKKCNQKKGNKTLKESGMLLWSVAELA